MGIAVIYQSHYGTTKQYAEWIAEALDADLLERSHVKPEKLLDYEVVVYGGGLYAGGIIGIELVTKNPCKNLVIFTVGLANPTVTDYSDILSKNLNAELRSRAKVLHLQGGMDYKNLGLIHRGMMAIMKKVVSKKSEHERTDDDRALLETYGAKVDFTNREAIYPVVEHVNSIRTLKMPGENPPAVIHGGCLEN